MITDDRCVGCSYDLGWRAGYSHGDKFKLQILSLDLDYCTVPTALNDCDCGH